MDTLKETPTSEILENALSALPLKELSDEELTKVREILRSKLSEADSISNCRKHIKLHIHPESKKTN